MIKEHLKQVIFWLQKDCLLLDSEAHLVKILEIGQGQWDKCLGEGKMSVNLSSGGAQLELHKTLSQKLGVNK